MKGKTKVDCPKTSRPKSWPLLAPNVRKKSQMWSKWAKKRRAIHRVENKWQTKSVSLRAIWAVRFCFWQRGTKRRVEKNFQPLWMLQGSLDDWRLLSCTLVLQERNLTDSAPYPSVVACKGGLAIVERRKYSKTRWATRADSGTVHLFELHLPVPNGGHALECWLAKGWGAWKWIRKVH